MSSESGSKRTCTGNLDAQFQPKVHGVLFCFAQSLGVKGCKKCAAAHFGNCLWTRWHETRL